MQKGHNIYMIDYATPIFIAEYINFTFFAKNRHSSIGKIKQAFDKFFKLKNIASQKLKVVKTKHLHDILQQLSTCKKSAKTRSKFYHPSYNAKLNFITKTAANIQNNC